MNSNHSAVTPLPHYCAGNRRRTLGAVLTPEQCPGGETGRPAPAMRVPPGSHLGNDLAASPGADPQPAAKGVVAPLRLQADPGVEINGAKAVRHAVRSAGRPAPSRLAQLRRAVKGYRDMEKVAALFHARAAEVQTGRETEMRG